MKEWLKIKLQIVKNLVKKFLNSWKFRFKTLKINPSNHKPIKLSLKMWIYCMKALSNWNFSLKPFKPKNLSLKFIKFFENLTQICN